MDIQKQENECDYEYQTRRLWGLPETIKEADIIEGVDFGLLGNFACMMSNSGEAKAVEVFRPLMDAAREFIERVEKGEIRSKRTYAKFKEIIEDIENYYTLNEADNSFEI